MLSSVRPLTFPRRTSTHSRHCFAVSAAVLPLCTKILLWIIVLLCWSVGKVGPASTIVGSQQTMARRKTKPCKKRRSTPRRWASPTREQWAYAKAFHDAEDRQRKAKKKRRQAGRQPRMRKSKAKTKTEMTLMELARSFPDIAKTVSFHPKQSTFRSTVSKFPSSRKKINTWL